MFSLSPIVVGDIIMAIALVVWVGYSAFVQRKQMEFTGDLNMLLMIAPVVLVGYGIYSMVTNPSPEGLAVLLLTLLVFVFFGLGNGGITKDGIVGSGGFVTSWDRIKDIWLQIPRDKNSIAVMYKISGMPGTRHFFVAGASQKKISQFIKKYWGKAPGNRKPE